MPKTHPFPSKVCKRSKRSRDLKKRWRIRKEEPYFTENKFESLKRTCTKESEDFTPTAGTSSSKVMQTDTYIFYEDDELEDLLPNVEHPSLVSENTLSKSEYRNDNNTLPPLVIENVERAQDSSTTGHRIIDIMHFSKQLIKLGEHSKSCTLGHYKLEKEIRNGLEFTLVYFCDNCGGTQCITSKQPAHKNELNDAVVWGSVSIGIGYSQFKEMMAVLDIPTMSREKYKKHEIGIAKCWKDHLFDKMAAAGAKEKAIAIERGHIDSDGTPYIAVIGDGGWSRRTYGHSYDSLGGVGCLIGAETKQLLFIGVKEKFCYTCVAARKKKKDVSDHLCFFNYQGPSTGMEQDIILEGFCTSIKQHGLKYKYYIGDGDSSVYKKITERVPYGREVEKIECANHMAKNYRNHLHKLTKNLNFPIAARKALDSRIGRLKTGARKAIQNVEHISFNEETIFQLREDLRNGPSHVFGDHTACRDVYCKRKKTGEENLVPLLQNCGLMEGVMKAIDPLINKADKLVWNQTTNQAERLMSLVAKFTGGKRVNHAGRGSYHGRCMGAGLAHSSGPSWHSSPWKRKTGHSPGSHFKKEFKKREKRRASRALSFASEPQKKKRKFRADPDLDYGPLAANLEIDETDLVTSKEKILQSLKDDVSPPEKINIIERSTVGQHENIKWREIRRNRLTASHFGSVIKRKDTTPCDSLVKTILYKKELNTEAITFGRLNERKAKKKYEEIKNMEVRDCGIFIYPGEPYLGASPDGLVGDDGLVEVKCLLSVGTSSLKEFVKTNKNTCLEENNNHLALKRSHKYYDQIQGQLNICNKKYCDFVVYTKNDFFIERIERDGVYWENKMLPKLKRFYSECLLPEIVDPQIIWGRKARDPQFIKDAQMASKNNTSAFK